MGEMTGGVMGLRSDSLPAGETAAGDTVVVSTGVSSACLRLALLCLLSTEATSALLAAAAAAVAADRRVAIVCVGRWIEIVERVVWI